MMLDTIVNISTKNMHLFILAIYAYVLFQIEENDYVTMVLLTVAACLSICYIQKKQNKKAVEGLPSCGKVETYVNNVNNVSNMEAMTNKKKKKKEGFENGGKVMKQLSDTMGPFDGLCLQTGNKQPWMKTPDETALIPNDSLFTFLSSQGPTKPMFTDNSALTGPTIDGNPDSAKKLFMFANNRSSPNCCPSTFSTSTGCVCTTKNQRDFVASRGAQDLSGKADVA